MDNVYIRTLEYLDRLREAGGDLPSSGLYYEPVPLTRREADELSKHFADRYGVVPKIDSGWVIGGRRVVII